MQDQVLIIDDSLALQQLIRATLTDQSVAVHSAYDGEAGLNMAADLRPGMILLDVDMPQMDGFEVCRRLKANKDTASIPIMFITADFATQDKVRGLDLGAVDYITKPFQYAELRARVHSALRTRHLFEQRVMVDGVTGLWNKAYLEDHLATQLSLTERNGQPISCIMADVDELARVNTAHGWHFGNEMLRKVSNLILGQCRAEDAVCYCGHGRFSILVSGLDRRAASRLADRLCTDIREKCAVLHGKDVGLTCSFGVADSVVASEGALLERAEFALTRAKLNGRGSVSTARPPRTKLAKVA